MNGPRSQTFTNKKHFRLWCFWRLWTRELHSNAVRSEFLLRAALGQFQIVHPNIKPHSTTSSSGSIGLTLPFFVFAFLFPCQISRRQLRSVQVLRTLTAFHHRWNRCGSRSPNQVTSEAPRNISDCPILGKGMPWAPIKYPKTPRKCAQKNTAFQKTYITELES